ALGAAGDRVRRGEGAGDGPDYADPVQGVDDDEQLHDRCDGGGERGDLSGARVYRSGAGVSGDAGRAGRVGEGSEGSDAGEGLDAADSVCVCDSGAGCGDDRQRLAGEGVMSDSQTPKKAWLDDDRMEQLMGLLLRFGVVLASTVVLAGGAFYLEDH